ncbi:hypothetical protein AVEN_270469-1 [Araneus ventricosus]|uniref:Uncharacterized protein n=1 Tax=Araneus ventricosus TaxID=182803 RepID=A0A4Y2B6X5_ARAVE|nr:hypothetical protein AVEN_270469-1 [Araneus ventricosus]
MSFRETLPLGQRGLITIENGIDTVEKQNVFFEEIFDKMKGPRCPSGEVFTSGPEGFQARNPIPLKIRRVWGLLHVKSHVETKFPSAGVVRKF